MGKYLGAAKDYLLILIGAGLQAAAIRLFLVPAQLAGGGVSGIAQLINHYTGFPMGVMILLGNAPLFVLGWRFLGGRRFALRTAAMVGVYAVLIDLLVPFVPPGGITSDLVLNTLYGGVIGGIGGGLIYLGKGTSGGSDILARILNHWRGIPVSQSYLAVDAAVILSAGFVFGWERALYALVMLYVSGIAAETVMQGRGVARMAFIVTAHPAEVAAQIMGTLHRGVTMLPGTGAYTGAARTMLYCVISRSEVNPLKLLIHEADPAAFMVIGNAHEALGEGFQPLEG
jgi:uncharacterized membrane-anchored protein YitT (DUF2179 family)